MPVFGPPTEMVDDPPTWQEAYAIGIAQGRAEGLEAAFTAMESDEAKMAATRVVAKRERARGTAEHSLDAAVNAARQFVASAARAATDSESGEA